MLSALSDVLFSILLQTMLASVPKKQTHASISVRNSDTHDKTLNLSRETYYVSDFLLTEGMAIVGFFISSHSFTSLCLSFSRPLIGMINYIRQLEVECCVI